MCPPTFTRNQLVPLNLMDFDELSSFSLKVELEDLHIPGALVLKQGHLLTMWTPATEPDRAGI